MKNHLISAFRTIIHNRGFALINISNLMVGFVCFILIAFWIKHETSFDNFHPNSERTYRIAYNGVLHGEVVKDATTSKALYEVLTNDFPEVEVASITMNFGDGILTRADGVGFRLKLSGVNPNFFDVFDVPIIKGDINELLKPNTTFITQETAVKLFGDKDPIGEVISTGMDRENKKFTIAGIIGEMPGNSHFVYDMLYSNSSQSWYLRNNTNWLNTGFHNYVVFNEGVDVKEFEKKFNERALTHFIPEIKNWQNITLEEWLARGDYVRFNFHPIQRVHLTPSFENEYSKNGDVLYIYIFLLVGLLVLTIAIINFSNLSTVKSLKRAKEIGVRKTFGSKRSALIIQFLVESLVLSFLALVFATILIVFIDPYFENFTGVKVWDSSNMNWWVIIVSPLIALVTGVLGGSFPAFFISKQSPIKALSSSFKIKIQGVFLKDVLISTQFIISVSIIIGAIIITKQLNYLQNDNLGFNKDNIVVINGTEDLSWDKNQLLNIELSKLNGVIQSSSSQFIPNTDFGLRTFRYNNENQELLKVMFDVLPCDQNYQRVYQFEMLQGTFFGELLSKDSRKIVLNEKAASKLNNGDCIGMTLKRGDHEYEVIGVVKDFYYKSRQSELSPMALVQIPDADMFWSPLYCSVLIDGASTINTIESIENLWKEIAPNTNFSFTFFDDDYNKIYEQEMLTKKLFVLFSFIAFALSCFGLFGFVNYLIQTRTKEIGIRKVNGATDLSIFILLSKYYISPITWSLLIAFPASYFLIKMWLENFAYRIEISWLDYVVSGLITLAIALFTVSWQSYKAAKRNPVEALRYE